MDIFLLVETLFRVLCVVSLSVEGVIRFASIGPCAIAYDSRRKQTIRAAVMLLEVSTLFLTYFTKTAIIFVNQWSNF